MESKVSVTPPEGLEVLVLSSYQSNAQCPKGNRVL